MAETKTKPNTGDVDEFLSGVDPAKQADSRKLIEMMRAVSREEPVLWGTMVGFGEYHYRYDSGHEGDAFRIGFAPRKAEFSLYVLTAYAGAGQEREAELLGRLGKHRAGKSCLYVKRLSDVDETVLRELVEAAWGFMAERYPQ
jgi:hypothetical protein